MTPEEYKQVKIEVINKQCLRDQIEHLERTKNGIENSIVHLYSILGEPRPEIFREIDTTKTDKVEALPPLPTN